MEQVRLFDIHDEEQIQALTRPLAGVAFNWSQENLHKELTQAKTWVLEVDHQIKAFICIRDIFQAWDLTIVATEKSAHRKGHMRKLMSFIIDKYSVDRPLWLEVHQNNLGAQKFYQAMGFIHSGTRGGYYSDGSAALLYTFHNPLLY